MGIHIKIRKLKKKDNTHYYAIFEDLEEPIFFIGIDDLQKKIFFYRSSNVNEPYFIVDLNKKNEKLLIPLDDINSKTYTSVIVSVMRALKQNYLPDILDYES